MRSGPGLRGVSPLVSFNHVIDPHLVTFSSSLYTTIRKPNLDPNHNPTLITDPQIGPRNPQIVTASLRIFVACQHDSRSPIISAVISDVKHQYQYQYQADTKLPVGVVPLFYCLHGGASQASRGADDDESDNIHYILTQSLNRSRLISLFSVLIENNSNGAANLQQYVTTWIITHPVDPAILFVSQKAPRKYA